MKYMICKQNIHHINLCKQNIHHINLSSVRLNSIYRQGEGAGGPGGGATSRARKGPGAGINWSVLKGEGRTKNCLQQAL